MSDLHIQVDLDTTRLEVQEANWKGRVERLNDDLSRTEVHMLMVSRKVMGAISSTITTMRSTLRAFGISLPAAWEAIVGAVMTTIASLQAIAAAYAAGGITAALAIPVELAAIGLAAFSVICVLTGQSEASRRLDDSEMALRSLGTTLTSWGLLFGSWE
jgi:hypothetical protein